MKWIGVVAGALLAGCVSAEPVFTASGQKGHVISCTPGWNGGIVGAIAHAQTSWGTCYQKAGEICGARGFTVLEKVGETGERVTVSRYGGDATTTNNRVMVIQCKGQPEQPVGQKAK